MRRLVKHAAAGVAFAGMTIAAGVAVLGSPAVDQDAIAVPAPLISIAPAPSPSAVDPAIAAEQIARAARESREAQRAELSAAAVTAASTRQASLGKQSKAITAQQAKIKSDRAKAKAAARARAAQAKAKAAQAKAKAEEANAKAEARAKAAAAAARKAKALVVKNRGYQPGTTDPREIARQILKNKYNYGADQYECFNYIIMRESVWKVNATNPSSGAYGIPQALPGSKMATVGSDWRTNPATQIIWAIGYMKDRYGSPCSAKTFKAANGWY